MIAANRYERDGIELWKQGGTGEYCIRIKAPERRARMITTGCTDLESAFAMVKETGVEKILMLHYANALTSQTIALATCGRLVKTREVFNGWRTYIREELSRNTVAQYLCYMEDLFKSGTHWQQPIASITQQRINDFVNRPGKASTRHVRLAACRSLWTYAKAHNHTVCDFPALARVKRRTLTLLELESTPAVPITEAEYRTMMASDKFNHFWKTSIALAYWTGLRFIDCCCLEWESLKPDLIIVWTKKRTKRVALPLDDPLIGSGELRQVLADLSTIPRADATYCFPAMRDLYLNGARNNLPMFFMRTLRKIGIEYKSFHGLRHSCASRLAAAGRTIEEVGRVLGHSNEATTAIYVHKESA